MRGPFPLCPQPVGAPSSLVLMPTPADDLPEVARIARDLIRIDTTNWGDGKARGEREAAEYVGAYLEGLGLEPECYEPVPRRTNVMARVPGRDRDRPALILHGHLDVVPAIAEDWSVDPFEGVVRDGMLWGRGAVDMKNMDAMILTATADLLRAGEQPERDLVLAFFAMRRRAGSRAPRSWWRTARSGSPGRPKPSARSAATRSPSATAVPICCRWARRLSRGSASSPEASPPTGHRSTARMQSRASPRR